MSEMGILTPPVDVYCITAVNGPSSNHKSELGLPPPKFPVGIDWKGEARRARRRLYPVTVTYLGYGLIVLFLAFRSASAWWQPIAWFAAGAAAWTWVEYLVHRFILHGRFPKGAGMRKVSHDLFDHLHYEHHARPWDGNHINGTLKDTLPALGPVAALSFLAPVATAPTFLAGLMVAYIGEEWVHQSVHFYDFRSKYWRYIKRHHWFHHSQVGVETGYGLTNGFWDIVHATRIPWDKFRRSSLKKAS